ncbi:hypothetical protein BJV77DRAFT_690832 [Russula vinacea]|nr:hypothetical protein BJV77DRAFT_690832 [Russula vinacea]
MPPSSLVLVGYSHGHTKCRYPLCATRADPATSTQSHVPACSHNTHHRHQRHATRRHQVVCIAWCAMGRTSASRDVRDRGIFRSVVRCIPERALYTKSIPPDEEARWYGLTDKTSSFIGPLIVGLVADLTGNIRYAFLFLVIMLWASLLGTRCSLGLTSNVGGLTHGRGHHMGMRNMR